MLALHDHVRRHESRVGALPVVVVSHEALPVLVVPALVPALPLQPRLPRGALPIEAAGLQPEVAAHLALEVVVSFALVQAALLRLFRVEEHRPAHGARSFEPALVVEVGIRVGVMHQVQRLRVAEGDDTRVMAAAGLAVVAPRPGAARGACGEPGDQLGGVLALRALLARVRGVHGGGHALVDRLHESALRAYALNLLAAGLPPFAELALGAILTVGREAELALRARPAPHRIVRKVESLLMNPFGEEHHEVAVPAEALRKRGSGQKHEQAREHVHTDETALRGRGGSSPKTIVQKSPWLIRSGFPNRGESGVGGVVLKHNVI